jgi:hypothetical protein
VTQRSLVGGHRHSLRTCWSLGLMGAVRNTTRSAPVVERKTFSSQEGNKIVRKNIGPVILICMNNNRTFPLLGMLLIYDLTFQCLHFQEQVNTFDTCFFDSGCSGLNSLYIALSRLQVLSVQASIDCT